MELEPNYKIMAQAGQEAADQLAWLQSQVIVLEEGSEPIDGDIVELYGEFDSLYGVYDSERGKLRGIISGEHHFHKILARICPTEGKLKAVVVRKGEAI